MKEKRLFNYRYFALPISLDGYANLPDLIQLRHLAHSNLQKHLAILIYSLRQLS